MAFHEALQGGGLVDAALPFADLDIVCAVPDAEIDWALRQRGAGSPFCGWRDMKGRATMAWDRDRVKFKDSFIAVTGVSVDTVLRTLREGGRTGESPQIKGLLAALLEHLEQPNGDAGLTVLNAHKRHG